MGEPAMLAHAAWPVYDPAKCVDQTVEMVVQICGKIKARILVPAEAGQEEVTAAAKAEKAESYTYNEMNQLVSQSGRASC